MKQRKKSRTYFEDDGRVIAPMNVEGMPWYVDKSSRNSISQGEQLSPKQERMYRHAVVKAALCVGLVFIAVFAIFILFCLWLWK